MEELLEILKDTKDGVDFETCTDLIDAKILTSFDIIQLLSALEDEYDISIPARELTPANFNSAEAILALLGHRAGERRPFHPVHEFGSAHDVQLADGRSFIHY